MAIILTLTVTATILIIDVKLKGAWTIVRWHKYRYLQDRLEELEHERALSGNAQYMSIVHSQMQDYNSTCRRAANAEAALEALQLKLKLHEEINSDYRANMSLAAKEQVGRIGVQQHSERDDFSGQFVPADGENESKYIRAYRLYMDGLEEDLIAQYLKISPQSVRTYINSGYRELSSQEPYELEHLPSNIKCPADFLDEKGQLYHPYNLEEFLKRWSADKVAIFKRIFGDTAEARDEDYNYNFRSHVAKPRY